MFIIYIYIYIYNVYNIFYWSVLTAADIDFYFKSVCSMQFLIKHKRNEAWTVINTTTTAFNDIDNEILRNLGELTVSLSWTDDIAKIQLQ